MTGLAASSYYYRPKRDPVARARREANLVERIDRIHATQPRTGYRMMKHYLARDGIVVSGRRLRRLMKDHGLQAQVKRAFVRTTDSDHPHEVYPNLVKGLGVDGINQMWVSDITYVRIATGFVYLAVILDLYSRRVVGWAISKRIDGELTLSALRDAIAKRRPPKGCFHHSDRGVQYAYWAYVKLLKDHGFHISMSAKGNPYDNAYAESFMKTLKYDEVYLHEYETWNDVLERLPAFIEQVYNRTRLHSRLGYVPPVEFEKTVAKTHSRPLLIV
jgi:putative transposase